MYKEPLKMLVLIVLVITSCILTYKAWSFQPEFKRINTTLTTAPSTSQGEPVEFRTIMRTYQVIHVEDNRTNVL